MRIGALRRCVRLVGAWMVLGAILACGGGGGGGEGESASSSGEQGASSASTQGARNRSFFIGPGFTPDPMTATGDAGGPFDASTRNPQCRGYIGAVSNHTLHLTRAFTNLRILVNAPQDTTLVVQLSNGEYRCNDDAEGLNPIVQGPFPAGIHRIYVGTIQQRGNASYTLAVTENATLSAASLGASAAPNAPPSAVQVAAPGSPVTLQAGFLPDPQTGRGAAGGPTDASTLNPMCRGFIPASPQHTLALQSAFANLRVIVNSTTDTSLVIRGPDGSYRCNDDAEGLNPIVEGAWNPGAYQVFVGTFAPGNSANYVIGFTERPGATAASLGQ